MPYRQERLRVLSPIKVAYVEPQCQYGKSWASCSQQIERVKVRATFPAEREYTVKICSVHLAPFIAEAKKSGHLA